MLHSVNTNAGSSVRIYTDASYFEIGVETTLYDVTGTYDCVSVIINGVYVEKYQPTSNSIVYSFPLYLGYKKFRNIDILCGKQNVGNPATGTWIRSLRYEDNCSFAVVTPDQLANKIVFIGDSITVGNDADDPSTTSYTGLLRLSNWNTANIVSFGSGSQSLFNMQANDTGFVNTAGLMHDYGATMIYLAIGMNDFNNETYDTKEDFGTAYSLFVDELILQNPDAEIVLQSIIPPPLDPNHNGDTYLQYRTIISNIATAKSLQYIDGNSLVTRAYMGTGSHPTNAGYRILATNIATAIGITPPI